MDELPIQEVADIPGNTAEIFRKHYGKWSKGRQDSIDRLMMAHFDRAAITKRSHKRVTRRNGAGKLMPQKRCFGAERGS